MCEECGCGELYEEEKEHASHHSHSHAHSHTQTMEIGLPALQKNNEYASRNRQFFKKRTILTVNLISSPGSGKTMLLEQMASQLGKTMAVIVGDIQTRRDAQRIEACGSQAYQIETNGACHLDAHSVGHALDMLDFTDVKICIIENVGNLVCPAAYDLGEAFKVAILSAPEGDDKVLKYPSIFSRASIVLINKMDIAGYLDFDVEKVKKECKSLNHLCDIFTISAKTGQGIEDFCQFLNIKRAQQKI
jgi:hydrogenase accessory protein HypB